jgi:ABC-type branched-subunit amino acid transport system substrate-binding protein
VLLLMVGGGVTLVRGDDGGDPGAVAGNGAGESATDGAGPSNARCPGIRPAEGTAELVGVGDGTSSCSFFPERPGAARRERDLDEKHQAVERTIAQANAEVEEGAALDPYRTVVFFAPLTVPYGPERFGQTSLRQLRGVALAQEEANRRALNDRAAVPLRVVLANPGDRFAQGPEVAHQVVELARTDPTVVGVVGIAQSRASSREAVGILGEAGLPVVAGPVTGDAMVDEALSDSYYQVSPRNEQIAEALADFATQVPIVGPAGDAGTDGLHPADDAVIILDPDDEYSQNLADDFQQAFTGTVSATGGAHATTRFPYAVDDGAASLDDIARRTCAALDNERDIVFFASRAQQLTGLLDNLADSDCADGVTVVAGSDITKLVQDPLVELGRYDFLRLYYASFGFATPDLADLPGDVRLGRAATAFVEQYTERYPPGTTTFDIGDPALSYDAFRALEEAIDHAATRSPEPTGPEVSESLAAGVVGFEGASGYVTFDRPDGSVGRAPLDKLLLVVEVQGRTRRIELLCGRLTESTTVDTWGDEDLPCPAGR